MSYPGYSSEHSIDVDAGQASPGQNTRRMLIAKRKHLQMSSAVKSPGHLLSGTGSIDSPVVLGGPEESFRIPGAWSLGGGSSNKKRTSSAVFKNTD